MSASLLVGKLPERTGVYLSVEEGTTIRPLARFLSEATSDAFMEYFKDVIRAQEAGIAVSFVLKDRTIDLSTSVEK